MRRVLLALVVVVLAAPLGRAQLIPSFGVTGGLNFGSLGDAATAELGSATGFHAGVYADMGLGSFAIRPALLYTRAGNVESGGEEQSVSFVTVPIDLKFQTPTPVVKAYGLAGPEFRFPFGGDEIFDTKAVNVAANVGAGVSFNAPLVGPSGFAEVRYAYDVTGLAEAVSGTESEYRVNLFMLRVGVGL